MMMNKHNYFAGMHTTFTLFIFLIVVYFLLLPLSSLVFVFSFLIFSAFAEDDVVEEETRENEHKKGNNASSFGTPGWGKWYGETIPKAPNNNVKKQTKKQKQKQNQNQDASAQQTNNQNTPTKQANQNTKQTNQTTPSKQTNQKKQATTAKPAPTKQMKVLTKKQKRVDHPVKLNDDGILNSPFALLLFSPFCSLPFLPSHVFFCLFPFDLLHVNLKKKRFDNKKMPS